MKKSIHSFDRSAAHWVKQRFSGRLHRLTQNSTVLGDPITISLIASFIIGVGIYSGNIQLLLSGVVIPAVVLVGAGLKMWFRRARPLTSYAAKLRTLSFPSGHSSGSMIAYGLLAYLAVTELPLTLGLLLATGLIGIVLLVGISRIYLGAHYPSDVIAGWLLGGVGLVVIILAIGPSI